MHTAAKPFGALSARFHARPETGPEYDRLRAYAERAGLDIVGDYCDIAVSGRKEGRPRLNALMTSARNRELDCVLVWKFDRFARSTRHLPTALEEFDHRCIRFHQRPGSDR
ncbi:recombinase family protein [Rhizobium sp. VS19-DR121]|uniref:recombinase family protein n=1 Tax=Rhizobium sp. VS19-DR121 TaxID=2875955 RepID=UPI001CC71046|nr:recombinase family protein [Rhizobium sp. VS19-DR121]MBZ5787747.1 recombinase family protein [Rhizobium sp. VS19-DR121]